MDTKRDETVKYGKQYNYFSLSRPWGWQQCFCENADSITVKMIHINKSEMLSLQRHKGRDQLYIVVDAMQIQYEESDSQIVTIDAKPGDTFYFPRGTLHRALNNTDKEIVSFFEVASGVNDEGDIERLADKYQRGNG